jgi:3alpha(or 20beta)-hydroxysteroid dehydrogenase
MTNQDLAGRIVLVTGAGRGQGLCEARVLAEQGATVLLGEVDEEAGRRAASGIPHSRFVVLDVTSEASWDRTVRTIADEFGHLDVLVNNAGILRYGTIETTPLDEVRRIRAVNLDGPYLGIQKLAPLFGERGGSIINIASISGLMGRPDQAAYLLSKWGLRGLGRAAALELAPRRIRVNTIFPGLIATEMSEGRYGVEGVQSMGRDLPVGRAGAPSDIASLVLFLASDRSSFITGAELVCDGGFTAGMQ